MNMLLQVPSTTAAHNWSQEFRSGTSQHWLVIGVCASLMVIWCITGKRLLACDTEDGRSKERRLKQKKSRGQIKKDRRTPPS